MARFKVNKSRSDKRQNYGRSIGSARHIKDNQHRSDRKAAKWELDLCRVDVEALDILTTPNLSAALMNSSPTNPAESVSTAA